MHSMFFFTFDITEHSVFEKKWDVDKSLNDKCEKTSEKDKTAQKQTYADNYVQNLKVWQVQINLS